MQVCDRICAVDQNQSEHVWQADKASHVQYGLEKAITH